MRKLVATVFNYSLDGFLADPGTDFWDFCFSFRSNTQPNDPAHLEFLRTAYAHVMGRTAYEGTFEAMTTSHRPSLRRDPERRPQGRLLANHGDGRVEQHHHRHR